MVKKTTKQIKKANSTAKIKTKVNPNTKIKTKVIPVIKAKTKVNPNIKTKVKAKPWKVFKQKVIRDLKNAKTEEEFSIVINRIVTFIMTARLNSLTRNFNIQINKLSRI